MVNYCKSFRKQLIACHLITLPVLSQFQMPHYISIRKDDLCWCSLSFFDSLGVIVYGSGLCLCVCVRVCVGGVCVCVCVTDVAASSLYLPVYVSPIPVYIH